MIQMSPPMSVKKCSSHLGGLPFSTGGNGTLSGKSSGGSTLEHGVDGGSGVLRLLR